MKIFSTDLANITCSKKPEYVSEVFSTNEKTKIGISISNYNIQEQIIIFVGLDMKFYSSETNVEVGKFNCTVCVALSLGQEELKGGEDLKSTINFFAVAQSWPIFEAQVSLLKDIKIEFDKLPPAPSKEGLTEKTNA